MYSKSVSRRAIAKSTVAGVAVLSMAPRLAYAQATPTTNAFPVSIYHVYGSTTIEERPERVVTIGWSTYDAVIALGVIPAAMQINTWGGDAEGFLPLTREAIGDNPLPVGLDSVDGLPFEDIVAVQPDVILALYSGITPEEYETLSQIAPTVAYPETAWSGSWQELTLTTGIALGLGPEAEQLVDETTAMIQLRAEEYPALAGKTFVYGNMGDGAAFNIYTKSDARPLFMESLGLVPSELVENLEIDEASPYYVPVSYERANEVVGDIVIFWFTDQAEYDAATETAYLQAIPAYVEDRFVAIIGRDYVMATSAWSTLSIAYALDEFLPALGAAAANVDA